MSNFLLIGKFKWIDPKEFDSSKSSSVAIKVES